MRKELFYEQEVVYYELNTYTLQNADGTVTTHCYVDWHTRHGQITHEISKEFYDKLLRELEEETNKAEAVK